MDCSPIGSSVHGIFQARILMWVAVSYSSGYSLQSASLASPALTGVDPLTLCHLGNLQRPHKTTSTRPHIQSIQHTLYLVSIDFLLSLYFPSSPYLSIAIRGMGSSGLVLCCFSLIWPWPLHHSGFAALVLGSGVLILAPEFDMALLSCLASYRQPSFQHLFLLLSSKPQSDSF